VLIRAGVRGTKRNDIAERIQLEARGKHPSDARRAAFSGLKKQER